MLLFRKMKDNQCIADIEYQRRIFMMLENLLDNHGNGNLTDLGYFEIIKDAIEYRHASGKWQMLEYVVMPNHVHLFFKANGSRLSNLMKDFKRWTVTEFKKLEDDNSVRWQREWFDHWSRSTEKDETIVEYIRNNPVKAGFVEKYQDWQYGSWSKSK